MPTAAQAAAALAGGIVLGRLRCLEPYPVLFASVILSLFCYMFKQKVLSKTIVLVVLLLTGLLLSAQAWQDLDRERVWPEALTPSWTGTVVSVPRVGHARTRLVVDTPAGRVEVSVPGRQPQLLPGDRLEFRRIPVQPPRATNPGQRDVRRMLGLHRIHWRLYLEPVDAWQHTPVSRPGLVRTGAVLAGRWQGIFLDTLPPAEGALLASLVLGQREDLPEEVWEWFHRTGLGHLLAVSGFHVGFGMLLTGAVGRLAGLKGAGLGLVKLAGVWLFAAAAGFQTGVTRAALMITIGLGAVHWGRQQKPAATLGVTGLCLLAGRPLLLFDPGFQLSMVATAAILEGLPRLQARGAAGGLWTGVKLSLLVQAAVLPLVAVHFHRLVWTVPFTQVVVAPMVGAAVLLGLAAGWCGLVWLPLADALMGVNELVLRGLLNVLEWLACWSGHGWNVSSPGVLWSVVWYGLLLALVKGSEQQSSRRHMGWVTVMLVWLALWAGQISVLPFMEPVRVTVLDVGQGDALVIQTRCGLHVLLDGGNRLAQEDWVLDQGTRVVIPFLRQAGIQRVDVVISHAHDDHIGGLTAVVHAGMAKQVWAPPQEGNTENWGRLEEARRDQNVQKQMLVAGDELALGRHARLIVLSPPQEGIPGVAAEDLNNHSLVLLLVAGEQRMLLTGDLEEAGIRWLLEHTGGPEADILKVPHHGSSGSYHAAWYRAVHPSYAVILVGSNRFGHPGQDVVDDLDRHTRMLRTDRDGAVEFRIWQKHIQVMSYRERSRIWY